MSHSRTALQTHDAPTDDASVSEHAPEDEAEEPSLSKDEAFHLLQNERRRLVLRYLQGRDDPVRMSDVAEQVAAWENDTTVQQISSKERQRAYIPLYQSHLPKLDKAGIIDYNQSRGIVERKPLADRLERHLDVGGSADGDSSDAESGSDFSSGRFAAVTGVSAIVFFGAVFEVMALPTLTMAVLLAVGLLAYSVLTTELFDASAVGRTDRS